MNINYYIRQKNSKRRIWNIFRYLFLFFLLFGPIFVFGCSSPLPYSRSEKAMGTNAIISVFDSKLNRAVIKRAVDEAFGEMERVDLSMSNYRGDSEVSRINNLKVGEEIKVSNETMDVLFRSQQISRISNGAFDITVLPLMKLWGFYSKSGRDARPTDREIEGVLGDVGYTKIILGKENKVTKGREGVKIDLGGIAKGYAVDRAVQRLKFYGIRSAMVEAGGDFLCLGTKPNRKAWRIAIQHPRDKHKTIAILEVANCAIATSGDYENYDIIESRRYSHIIDPRTGLPKADVPASVTVVAKDAATADGLATAIFVLGPDKGMDLAERLSDVDAVIISDEEGKIESVVSSGLKDKIKFTGN